MVSHSRMAMGMTNRKDFVLDKKADRLDSGHAYKTVNKVVGQRGGQRVG